MQHIHEMPFGPQLLKEGGAKFRIWAPEAKTIKLSLNRSKTVITEMTSGADGWYTATIDDARAGDSYHFIVDDNLNVPDPASRYQPNGVHGPSQLINPSKYNWKDDEWYGRPIEEAIIYELHTGTFSEEGTFQGIQEKLDYLENLGVTAIELMPVSDFPGEFNWGYDGVLPFAPARCYGTPDDLKDLINDAHQRGIMVFLDVVYNHLGPDGNYMYVYANSFFSKTHSTPWGSGPNYDHEHSEIVRQYVVDNVLYWLSEYRFDGLRFDATDTISDTSKKHILTEIGEAVRSGPGKERAIHLILENVSNQAKHLNATNGDGRLFDSQWNDDIHHACHVLATGEDTGYYADFTEETSGTSALEHLGKSLAEGYSYQGEHSTYWGDKSRGEPSNHLPPEAFINFIQNHDQVGNRAFGERITTLCEEDAVRAIVSIVMLSPSIPMLFMGEEWGSKTSFHWFADVGEDLAEAVRAGRAEEFGKFDQFQDANTLSMIPDPCAEETFLKSRLDWNDLSEPEHQNWLGFYKLLIELRKRTIVPLIKNIDTEKTKWRILEEGLLKVVWPLKSGGTLKLFANMTDQGNPAPVFTESEFIEEHVVFQTPSSATADIALGTVEPWSVIWLVDRN